MNVTAFIFILLQVSLFPNFLLANPSTECGQEKRAAIDVGSGTTKFKVAEVDTCHSRIKNILYTDQKKIDFKQSLELSTDGNFSQSLQTDFLSAMETWRSKAKEFNAKNIRGVATAAFREARNANHFIELARGKGIDIKIINQTEEATLGLRSVQAHLPLSFSISNIVVWDIGGGSQQIIAMPSRPLQEQPTPPPSFIYQGTIASVSFRNQVISQIKKQDVTKTQSPNPLSKAEITASITLAQQRAQQQVPQALKKHLRSSNIIVVGIGGVHAKSLAHQLNSYINKDTPPFKIYHRTHLRQVLEGRAGWTDEKIGGSFASTDITNMALVLGYMETLSIDTIHTLDVDLTDGLLIE